MQPLTIPFAGVITDRQSFLDGARVFTIEAEDQPSTGRRLTFSFRWPINREAVEEGDLSYLDASGAELFASLADGTAAEITDEHGEVNAGEIDLHFDVTGGEGSLANATGRASVTGTIAGQGAGTGGSFEGEGVLLTLQLSLSGVSDDALTAAPEAHIPTGSPRRYQEPGGGPR
jgi:hypothetical protein